MKNKAEKWAEEYIKEVYGEDPHYVFATEIRFSKIGFNAGFSAKEEIIKDKISTLENSKGFKMSGLTPTKRFNSQQEQMEYAKRIDEVIEILKSLL